MSSHLWSDHVQALLESIPPPAVTRNLYFIRITFEDGTSLLKFGECTDRQYHKRFTDFGKYTYKDMCVISIDVLALWIDSAISDTYFHKLDIFKSLTLKDDVNNKRELYPCTLHMAHTILETVCGAHSRDKKPVEYLHPFYPKDIYGVPYISYLGVVTFECVMDVDVTLE